MAVHSLLPLPCTTIILPYSLEANVALWGIRRAPLKPFGFLQMVATNPPRTGLKSWEARQASTTGWDLLMSLLFFLNKSSGYELLSHVSFLWWILHDSNLTGQPAQYLIKFVGNGEVNYALTALAPINYSLGVFRQWRPTYLFWQSFCGRDRISIQGKFCKAIIRDCMYLSQNKMYEMQMVLYCRLHHFFRALFTPCLSPNYNFYSLKNMKLLWWMCLCCTLPLFS